MPRMTTWAIMQDLKDTGYDGVEIPMFMGEPAHFRALGAPDCRHGAAGHRHRRHAGRRQKLHLG